MTDRLYSVLLSGVQPGTHFPRVVDASAPQLDPRLRDALFGFRPDVSLKAWVADQLCGVMCHDHRLAAELARLDPDNTYRRPPALPRASCALSGVSAAPARHLPASSRWTVLSDTLEVSESSASLGSESSVLSWTGGLSSEALFPKAGVALRFKSRGSGSLTMIKPEPLRPAAALAKLGQVFADSRLASELARPGWPPLEELCARLLGYLEGLS